MSIKQITSGQDSFLDIVANLVGILIILVVVVSAQAGSAKKQEPQPNADAAARIAQLKQELSRSSDTAAKLHADNHQLEDQIVEENQLAASLTDKRHLMLVKLEVVKTKMAKQRVKNQFARETQRLKQESAKRDHAVALANHEAALAKRELAIQKQVEFETQKRDLENQLDELLREEIALEANLIKTEVIDHFPSPIAKTVFAEEIHFRLADGKLSYVPMDELIAEMKSEWKVKSEKLQQADRTIETLGPIANYRLQYELRARDVRRQTQYGAQHGAQHGVETGRTVEFSQFTIYPLAREFGETVEVAISPGSEFRSRLERQRSANTTVSIWVYPESFGSHNLLKTWLHENGFQVASWPLEKGKRISGGPNGFKTSAQ